MYNLLRGAVLRLLRAPDEPPDPPPGGQGSVEVFRASKKLLTLRLIPLLVVAAVLALSMAPALLGVVLAEDATIGAWVGLVLTSVVFVVFLLVRYLLIRLDYEMRYYLVTDRALRIREGAMHIQEHTYTYANIQNLTIHQGPLERLLGIANVRVQTAGGGGVPAGAQGAQVGHGGTLRGIENAEEVRDKILALLKAYRDAGLGDPKSGAKRSAPEATGRMSPAFVEALREVRDEIRSLGAHL